MTNPTSEHQAVVMPDFGERVSIKEKYRRQIKWRNKEYVTEPFEAEGIFLGCRIITNGKTDYDSEEGYTWRAKRRFKVALVCLNQNENPVYVPLDAIQIAL